jgi:hypothetical protein
MGRHCSSVCIVTTLRAGRMGLGFREGQRVFLSATASSPALEPTQPHIKWIPGVKRPGREATHLNLVLRLSVHGAIPPLPNASSWHSA